MRTSIATIWQSPGGPTVYAERNQARNVAPASPEHRAGFVEGVLWTAAFLRQGDLLPDGHLLQQDQPGLPDRDSTPDS